MKRLGVGLVLGRPSPAFASVSGNRSLAPTPTAIAPTPPPSPRRRDTAWAMSKENVEIVKAMVAALKRGDLDGALAGLAPDVEVRDLANGPDQPEVIRGTNQMKEVWALWLDAFDELHLDLEEVFDAGNAVVCKAHWIGRGATSGMSIDVRQFDVFEFRDGAIVRVVLGNKSKSEAIEAVGLSE
jgi:ketosteroid isomerase-like protein